MVCFSSNPHLWTSIVFSTYTFLPALFLHVVLRFSKRDFKYYLLYVPAIVFSLIAFLKSDFVVYANCDKFFVVANTFFTGYIFSAPTFIYTFYYFGFILLASLFWAEYINREHIRKLYLWWVWIGFLTSMISLILVIVVPSLDYQFPSVFCEFALFFTIIAVASSEAYYHRKNREKFIE
jgi:hypothetical protein